MLRSSLAALAALSSAAVLPAAAQGEGLIGLRAGGANGLGFAETSLETVFEIDTDVATTSLAVAAAGMIPAASLAPPPATELTFAAPSSFSLPRDPIAPLAVPGSGRPGTVGQDVAVLTLGTPVEDPLPPLGLAQGPDAVAPTPNPVPAAGYLLLTALAGFFAWRRRA